MITLSWPRRVCKGLHYQRGAFSHGGRKSQCVRGLPAPSGIMPSPVFAAPARVFGKYQTMRWREDGGTPTRKIHRPYVIAEARRSFCEAGGRRERLHLFRDHSSGSQTPPSHRCFVKFRIVLPDPGHVFNDFEANDDKIPHKQPEGVGR